MKEEEEYRRLQQDVQYQGEQGSNQPISSTSSQIGGLSQSSNASSAFGINPYSYASTSANPAQNFGQGQYGQAPGNSSYYHSNAYHPSDYVAGAAQNASFNARNAKASMGGSAASNMSSASPYASSPASSAPQSSAGNNKSNAQGGNAKGNRNQGQKAKQTTASQSHAAASSSHQDASSNASGRKPSRNNKQKPKKAGNTQNADILTQASQSSTAPHGQGSRLPYAGLSTQQSQDTFASQEFASSQSMSQHLGTQPF